MRIVSIPMMISLFAALLAGCTQTQTKEAPLSLEAQGKLSLMGTVAQEITTLLKSRADSTSHTPESIQLRLDWDEKRFDAFIKLHPDQHATWISDRAASTAAIAREVESRGTRDPQAIVDIVHYATAEVAFLQASDAGDKKAAGSARVDMATDAAHAALALDALNDIHSRTIAWKTLCAKWDWRAATGALETALPEMNPDSIADEWINMARQKRDAVMMGGVDSGASSVEDFNLARLQSLKAALRKDDKAVATAAGTMETAAQTVLDVMNQNDNAYFATPENLSAYLDWSHKRMEADWLGDSAPAAKRQALEAHAARVQAIQQKVPESNGLCRQMTTYAETEVEFIRATLK